MPPTGEGAATAVFSFSHATPLVVVGSGTRTQIAAHAGAHRRAFVVTDGFFADHPVCARIAGDLTGTVIHPIPAGEPTGASVTAARDALVAAGADLVVALGGGSAIDTAKAALAYAANPGDLKSLVWPEARIVHAHPARFIALPTTAGAGSEVSETAIVDLPGTIYKAHMRAPSLAPDVVILDPELHLSTPEAVTLSSGFDALTHAIEAYTSRAANPVTDPLAFDAVATLVRMLPRAARQPDDLEARAGCAIAALQAGIAFNSAHLGISHAIAGALGALHHVGHGLANALALPWTMAYNRPAMVEKDRALASLFGAETTAEGVALVRHDLGLDLGLDDFVTGADALDAVAEAAMTSGQIRMNPRTITVVEMRAILEAMRRPTGPATPRLSL